MSRNLPDSVEFLVQLAKRQEVEQLLAEDDAAPVIVRTADGLLRLRTDVPESRAECPTRRTAQGFRLCGFVLCKMNLANVADDGRPWHGPRTTLRPFWLENPLPPTCGLDLAEQARTHNQRGLSTREVSDALRCHETLTRRRLKEALLSLQSRGVDVSAWQLVIADEEEAAV